MEQTLDARALINKGDALLKEARPREAAVEYARAAQVDPNAVGAHIGLAQANVALGQFNIVAMACQAVLRLAPGSEDAYLAQAIDAMLARRYDQALAAADKVVEIDPTRAYAHALRGYVLRQLRQTYDASLAESKAARMSGTHDLVKLFPPVNPAVPEIFATPGVAAAPTPALAPPPQHDVRGWNQRAGTERAAVRARFATRNIPIITYILMAINIALYVVGLALSNFDLFNTAQHANSPALTSWLYDFGVEFGWPIVQQFPFEWYRVLTAMWLHADIYHIGMNMLSLYFVGYITERLFGRWRFLLIYLASGVIAGVAQVFFLSAGFYALGASGAIFGIFGAFGVYFLLYRRAFGQAANIMLGQWAFWLVINIVFTLSYPGIGIADHIGGLLAGMALATVLAPRLGRG